MSPFELEANWELEKLSPIFDVPADFRKVFDKIGEEKEQVWTIIRNSNLSHQEINLVLTAFALNSKEQLRRVFLEEYNKLDRKSEKATIYNSEIMKKIDAFKELWDLFCKREETQKQHVESSAEDEHDQLIAA